MIKQSAEMNIVPGFSSTPNRAGGIAQDAKQPIGLSSVLDACHESADAVTLT
jgi:hypothetical protein